MHSKKLDKMNEQNNTIKKKFDQAKQDAVVQMIENGETFSFACQEVGISRTLEWNERKENDLYAERIETAKELQIQSVEGKLYQMCMEKNISAICFYLKTNKPSKYAISMHQPSDERQRFQVTSIEMV